MKKVLFVCFALVLFQSAFAQKNKGITLAYNFQKGAKYIMTFGTLQDVKVMGQEMPQAMTFVISYEVLKADKDGTAEMKLTYDRIKFSQNNPMGQIDYDSDSKSAPEGLTAMIAENFGKLVKQSLVIRMKKNGEIVDVLEGDENLKQAFKQNKMVSTFPDKALKVGDSWSEDTQNDTGAVKIKVSTTYTLASIKDGKIVIESKGILKNGEGKEMGTQSGTSTYDQNDLMLVISAVVQDIKGMEVQGMTMDMTTKSNVSVGKK